jgi:DNA repair exonuclease SbcCD ATPase subunit
MKIRSIEWKNFGSYGNNTQKIVFDDQQGNFYLIVGSNGAGKSTISDVIKFGLYGKLDNKHLRDIPNRFNGNAFCRILLEKNSTTLVTIERGIAPNVFRLYVNGVEYDQAGKKNMQEFLEDELLGIPYYVFNNMISLSINDFKSFISMKVHDKRMIIDRLFGLEILGSIKWKVRYQIKLLKEQADSILTELSVLERTIAKSQEEMNNLNEKLKVDGEERKAELEEKMAKLDAYIQKAGLHLNQMAEKDRELQDSLASWDKLKSSLEYDCRDRHKKISLFEEGQCPTCESDLTTDYHKTLLDEYIKKNTEAETEIESIRASREEITSKRTKLKEMYDTMNRNKIVATTQKSSLQSDYLGIDAMTIEDNQTSSLKNIIDDSENKKKEAIHRRDLEEKKANFYKIIEDIFGDKGVKLTALKRILPLLNTEIKKVLLDLNMDYRVTFNEEFEVNIQHLGFNVSPDQLSTGERKKIDFAALLALIRLMKMKFSGVNLIFLDEIFSSIDSDGIYHILKVLHKTCRELNLNIFVINHSQLPTEIFDYRVEITKNNGFSNVKMEKIE